jgi:hypothetical protein
MVPPEATMINDPLTAEILDRLDELEPYDDEAESSAFEEMTVASEPPPVEQRLAQQRAPTTSLFTQSSTTEPLDESMARLAG